MPPDSKPEPTAKKSEQDRQRHISSSSGLKTHVRPLLEAVIFLAIAVVMMRTFGVEGYLITTGSMANSLKGSHLQVECPRCQFAFSVGAAFDDSSPQPFSQEKRSQENPNLGLAKSTKCPNCGEPQIPIREKSVTQGDQILIHKGGFLFREPKRFEPAVFRYPMEPHQVYIKRVIGLPGEAVQFIDGDVFINGERIVKTLTQQKIMRELLHTEQYRPQEYANELQPRWRAETEPSSQWRYSPQTKTWQRNSLEEQVTENVGNEKQNIDWLIYEHWLSQGGTHRSVVLVPRPPEEEDELEVSLDEELPDNEEKQADLVSEEEIPTVEEQELNFPFTLPEGGCPVQFDTEKYELSLLGVLTEEWYQQIAALNTDPEHLAALKKLKQLSHLAPLTDHNSYNPLRLQASSKVTTDLMLEVKLRTENPTGQFVLQIDDSSVPCQLVLDFETQLIEVYLSDSRTPLLSQPLPSGDWSTGRVVQFSTFDRQLLCALDGSVLFEKWSLPYSKAQKPYSRRPVRVGGAGGDFELLELNLYRDLYYRDDFPERIQNGSETAYQVGEAEYFVLGDNSMRSWDSRCWAKPVVRRDFLIGRPLVVHLPSQAAQEEIGSRKFNIRIPDLARIRLIH